MTIGVMLFRLGFIAMIGGAFSFYIIEISSHSLVTSIVRQLAAILLGFLALFFAAGYVVSGRLMGILISEQNRISLARFKLVVWIIIIFGGYATFSLWNIRVNAVHSFPSMQQDLWILLGIINVSTVASALITVPKSAANTPKEVVGPPPGLTSLDVAAVGQLDQRLSSKNAMLLDLITGEEATNRDKVERLIPLSPPAQNVGFRLDRRAMFA